MYMYVHIFSIILHKSAQQMINFFDMINLLRQIGGKHYRSSKKKKRKNPNVSHSCPPSEFDQGLRFKTPNPKGSPHFRSFNQGNLKNHSLFPLQLERKNLISWERWSPEFADGFQISFLISMNNHKNNYFHSMSNYVKRLINTECPLKMNRNGRHTLIKIVLGINMNKICFVSALQLMNCSFSRFNVLDLCI